MSNPVDEDVLQAIPDNHTIFITGGLKWESMPASTNIEDRRSPETIQRDQRWFNGEQFLTFYERLKRT